LATTKSKCNCTPKLLRQSNCKSKLSNNFSNKAQRFLVVPHFLCSFSKGESAQPLTNNTNLVVGCAFNSVLVVIFGQARSLWVITHHSNFVVAWVVPEAMAASPPPHQEPFLLVRLEKEQRRCCSRRRQHQALVID